MALPPCSRLPSVDQEYPWGPQGAHAGRTLRPQAPDGQRTRKEPPPRRTSQQVRTMPANHGRALKKRENSFESHIHAKRDWRGAVCDRRSADHRTGRRPLGHPARRQAADGRRGARRSRHRRHDFPTRARRPTPGGTDDNNGRSAPRAGLRDEGSADPTDLARRSSRFEAAGRRQQRLPRRHRARAGQWVEFQAAVTMNATATRRRLRRRATIRELTIEVSGEASLSSSSTLTSATCARSQASVAQSMGQVVPVRGLHQRHAGRLHRHGVRRRGEPADRAKGEAKERPVGWPGRGSRGADQAPAVGGRRPEADVEPVETARHW